jgi:ADP-dependent phosphofructokinase/glucokinase
MAEAELAAAAAIDGRVTAAAMGRAVDRAKRAATIKPVEQNVLSGFTRVVDAKLSLTPALLAALAAAVDAPDLLMAAIDAGPGDGAIVWPRPHTRVEFVASLVRQLVLGGGASMQLQIEPEHGRFLEGVIAAEGGELRRAMGGAGAFASNLLSVFPSVTPRFFSREPLPRAVADRFSARVEVIDDSGVVKAAHHSADDRPARVNFSCEYSSGQAFSVLGRQAVKIDGVLRPLEISGSGRVILGTRAKDIVPGFGDLSDDVIGRLASEHDIAFLVGCHHLTAGTPGAAQTAAQQLATTLHAMKARHPTLLRHHQYVLPKIASNEAIVMGATKGAFDSMSMNAVEVPALVTRLRAGRLTDLGVGIQANQSRDASEEPGAMIAGALAVADGMGVARVHLHGLLGDLVLHTAGAGAGAVGDDDATAAGPFSDDTVDVDRVRLALLRARQLASMKAANASGEIKGPGDVYDVDPVVQGAGLAAVERFADAIAERYSLSPLARDQVAADWHYFDAAHGHHVFFVPSRGIHDRTGGTVSLGDTIDISALVFSNTVPRPRVPPQLKARTFPASAAATSGAS